MVAIAGNRKFRVLSHQQCVFQPFPVTRFAKTMQVIEAANCLDLGIVLASIVEIVPGCHRLSCDLGGSRPFATQQIEWNPQDGMMMYGVQKFLPIDLVQRA